MASTRVAVVTGANKGIGYEIARGLGRSPDCLCVMACRSAVLGEAAAAQLKSEGCNVAFAPLDIGDAASIQAFAAHLQKEYGGLDILVNNAATAFKHSDPTPFSQQARPTLAVNFFATVAVCDALAPLLRPGGRVVNVASVAGYVDRYGPALQRTLTDPHLSRDALAALMCSFMDDVEKGVHAEKGWPSSCYGVSKAGLIAFTRVLARELQPRGVLVNAMCPGYCDTDMTSHKGPRPPAQGADTAVYLALLPDDGPTGQFWYDRKAYDWANGQHY